MYTTCGISRRLLKDGARASLGKSEDPWRTRSGEDSASSTRHRVKRRTCRMTDKVTCMMDVNIYWKNPRHRIP